MAATHLEQKLIDFEKCRSHSRKEVRQKRGGRRYRGYQIRKRK
jgi:hypothetical protein